MWFDLELDGGMRNVVEPGAHVAVHHDVVLEEPLPVFPTVSASLLAHQRGAFPRMRIQPNPFVQF
jgi:hypothetical protein